MNLQIYAVFDEKVKLHLQPFFMRTTAEATRAFQDLVNDPSTMFHKHPNDFYLCHIGEWSEEKGVILSNAAPVSLIGAKALIIELSERDAAQMSLIERAQEKADGSTFSNDAKLQPGSDR